jgi:hypothetical protein
VDVGDAFLDFFPGVPNHLWLVLTREQDDEVAMANVTSLGPHIRDETCILRPGDHPFVHHDSVVLYAKARIYTTGTIRGMIGRGLLEPRPAATPALMDRIRQGAVDSPFTPADVKAAVRNCWWCPPR